MTKRIRRSPAATPREKTRTKRTLGRGLYREKVPEPLLLFSYFQETCFSKKVFWKVKNGPEHETVGISSTSNGKKSPEHETVGIF